MARQNDPIPDVSGQWVRSRREVAGRVGGPRVKGKRFSDEGATIEQTGALQRQRLVIILSPDSTEGERGHWLRRASEAGCYVRVRPKPSADLPPECPDYGKPTLTEVQRITSGQWPDVYCLEAGADIQLALDDRIIDDFYAPVAIRLPQVGQGGAPAQATERKAYRRMMSERGRYGAMEADKVQAGIERAERELAIKAEREKREGALAMIRAINPALADATAARWEQEAQEAELHRLQVEAYCEYHEAVFAERERMTSKERKEESRVTHPESRKIQTRERKREEARIAREKKQNGSGTSAKKSGAERLEARRQEIAANAERMKREILARKEPGIYPERIVPGAYSILPIELPPEE